MEHRSRRQPLPTLSRPRTSPYDSIGHTLSGLEQRADKIAGQLAERGPTIEAHLRRLPSELQQFGARKLVPSTQLPMTVPKLLPRPFTAGPDAAELAQRSRSFTATLAVLRGEMVLPGVSGLLPGLLPRLPSEASLRRPQTEGTLSEVRGLRRRAASQSQIAMPSRVAARLDALTDAFVDGFKRGHKQRPACLKIQAAWRMHVERVYFLAKIRLRRECMRPPLRAWRRLAVAAFHSRRARKRAVLNAWRGEARLTLRLLRYLAHGLETVDGTRRDASGAAQAWHSFCEHHARRNHARDDATRRPADAAQLVAALQHCAVAACACQCLRAWRELAAGAWALRRQAGQRLRGTLQPQRRWPAETVMLALTMWSRYSKFMGCLRAGRAGPTYGHRATVPRWEEWECGQLQRDARRSIAAGRFCAALLRRMMRAWIGLVPFARSSFAKRGVAEHYCLQTYCGAALRQMRALVAFKRSRRGFFRLLLASWQQWARQHRREAQADAAALKVQSGPLQAAACVHGACTPRGQPAIRRASPCSPRRATCNLRWDACKPVTLCAHHATLRIPGGAHRLAAADRRPAAPPHRLPPPPHRACRTALGRAVGGAPPRACGAARLGGAPGSRQCLPRFLRVAPPRAGRACAARAVAKPAARVHAPPVRLAAAALAGGGRGRGPPPAVPGAGGWRGRGRGRQQQRGGRGGGAGAGGKRRRRRERGQGRGQGWGQGRGQGWGRVSVA